jgi:hypothetical protein
MTAPGGCFQQSFLTAFPATVPTEGRFVLLLEAYFDESGTHAGSAAVSVAGYIARPEQWIAFEPEWRKVLSDFGLEFFHWSDCESAAAGTPYAGWSREKRRDAFAQLVDITNRHAIASVGCVIERSLYEKHVPKHIQRAYNGLYGLAAQNCADSAATLVKTRLAEKGISSDARIAYVFEASPGGVGQVSNLFNENINDPVRRDFFRIQDFRFGLKKELPPLQAADILAYELFRYLPMKLGIDKKPERSFYTDRLESLTPNRLTYLEETELQKYRDVMTAWLNAGNKPPQPPKKRQQRRRRP